MVDINVTEKGQFILKEVFEPVLFETEEGEKIFVVMRDGGFEVGVKRPDAAGGEVYRVHAIRNGQVKEFLGAGVGKEDGT